MRETNGNGKHPENQISQNNYDELIKLLSNLIDRQIQTDNDYKTLVNVLEAMTEKLENLETRINQVEQSHQKQLTLVQGSLSTKVNLLNTHCLATWKRSQEDTEELKTRLDNVIMIPLLTLIKWIGVIMALLSLSTWLLIKILPPTATDSNKSGDG